MKQVFEKIMISTEGRGFYEITQIARTLLTKTKMKNGTLTLHIRHTSASLLIQENADPEVQTDLERFFFRICPDGDPLFQHTSEGSDDMPAHVRAALTSINTSIPFQNGALLLGIWQGIYLLEHRIHPHQRQIIAHFFGE